MSYELIEKLKKEIEGYSAQSGWEEIGRVMEVGDGLVKILGLDNVESQEILIVDSEKGPRQAIALNLEETVVGALLLEGSGDVKSNDVVKRTKKVLSIEIGPELLGRVVDPLGRPLDGRGPLFNKDDRPSRYPLERKPPTVLERQPVTEPLHTGIKSIDAMIPIGRGQRELIIGDRQTGKTAVILDAIINQNQEKQAKKLICIYVAVGQKESKVARIVQVLKDRGVLDYSVVVSATASQEAALWYLAPFAGCAIGEYFMDRGQDALVVYDDLSKHAWAWRQISLLLRRPPGREAYPGDIFYLHSRLLERAAKLSAEKGGGSLTALPIAETQLGDVTAYIPTNLISITDGQIYLESDLFNKGIRPAINIGLSVSRVGSSAQTKAMKKVAGQLRLSLAQLKELEVFAQFAADVDEQTQKKIRHGQVITEILKQEDLNPWPFEKQVVVLYAVLNGYFDGQEPARVKEVENQFVDYLEKLREKDILLVIRESRDLSEETQNKLKGAIESFFEINF